MPKVMFTISYGVRPEKREQYLDHVKAMSAHFTAVAKSNYAVYEVKGKRNQFVEVFQTSTVEEYEALEENQDEKTQELVARLDDFIDENGMRYQTLIEAA